MLLYLCIDEVHKVCLNQSQPFVYEFKTTNTSHKVKLLWKETDCKTSCSPQPCFVQILAQNVSHIVLKFKHVSFFFYKKQPADLINFQDHDNDHRYNFPALHSEGGTV